MASFITAGSEYAGEENENIFFRPRVKENLSQFGFRTILTNSLVHKLTFFGSLGKILMPYTKGWNGGSGAPQVQKKLTLHEFKAEAAYDKHDYFGTILEKIVNRDGVNQNDITGTQVKAAEQAIWNDALWNDIYRNFWLADTTKEHEAPGNYPDGTAYVATDPDKYYNNMDGVLTRIMAESATAPTANQIQKVVLTATLATDEAAAKFKEMRAKSPRIIKQLRNQGVPFAYYATDSVIENYRDTLESDGLESGKTMMVEGVQRLTYDGLPIIPINVDGYLASDFAATAPKDFIVLTTPENLAAVVNAKGGTAETRMWFNPDENENRQRSQFHFGADFILPELIVSAFKA